MEVFLKFLIYSLKTLDGRKDTATGIIQALNKQSIREYQIKFKRDGISKYSEHKLMQTNEYNFFQKIFMKYKIMTIRAKISFMALEKCMTVVELVVSAILKSYQQLVAQGSIEVSTAERRKNKEVFFAIIKGERGVLKKIINNSALQEEMEPHVLKNLEELRNYKPNVEKFTVKRFGVPKTEKINIDLNDEQEARIQKILAKDQCMDIFKEKNQTLKDKSMSHQAFIQYKFNKKSRELILSKLTLMLKLKLIGDIIYVYILLKRIEIAKELMVLEVEQGNEVLISGELSQDGLPASFRYYDSIIRIVQKMMKPNRREYYMNKKQLAHLFHQKSVMQNFLRTVGLLDQEKLRIQFKAINEKKRNEIDYRSSLHVTEI